ncbi:basic form of pathogenesis-related protein 1-like [Cucurbita maxima]|uniref:Basic form of pathogenesis-related protein 1-like n=1 Tax=Cucurbita maxima TaxID=3661 RepID=A0A6J1IDM7_CUCMA|nr:basic form of pathogenesis-related protein 1-like [Cucurbita maxima]
MALNRMLTNLVFIKGLSTSFPSVLIGIMWTQTLRIMAAFMVTFIFLLALTKAQNAPGDYLALHNRARAEVGVGPMQWSNTVAAYAQAYAEKRKGDCAMIHSTGPYGENIAAGYYPEFTGADAVKLWANEKPLYDHASNKCVGGECGHYTQMVWRSSVRLGCATVPCKANSQFVVCNYDPPGNYIGEKPYDSWVV